MNIKLLKLITGEEVICELKDEGDDVVMKNPIIMMPQRTEDGKADIAMVMKWMPSSVDESFKISKQHVMYISEPHIELANYYSETFGSGIVLPEKGSIQI